VFADPAGSTTIRIAPGTLYVEGVPARLDAPAPLAVNAQPEYPIGADYSGQNLRLYADVWERSVTALHDPALMDAALHGADTATRSQTMLQVKWCADGIDPMDPSVNPPLGDALLTLRLRSVASSGDPCDPCAAQVSVDERLGNALFRVEVHEYEASSGTLTLKWSRDNGAEAARVGETPPGFDQGDWVWEYFDDDTERLLGNHFAPNPTKLRGLIKESFGTPAGAQEPKTHVRQWDGYIVVRLAGAGTLVDGRDRGVDLAMGAQADTAHGRVHVDAGTLHINLERMELTLAANGKRFVAGDHWLATVREAAQESGDVVLADATPRGVRHHYLLLGELGVDRKLKAQDDAFRRRMAFPPLTDVVAGDVGFTDHCPGLFAGATNVQQALDNLCAIGADDIGFTDRCAGLFAGATTVQQALDNLCAIGAEDIAYRLPDCAASELQSIAARLKALLDPDGDGTLTVQAALDTLLCRLTAADLPLDKTDAALCADLQAADVQTVQQALKVLCDRAAGGCCEVPVKSSEELRKLLEAFAADPGLDLWVCLQPGHYELSGLPPVKGKGSLRLAAQSAAVVGIDWLDEGWSLQLRELALDGLTVTMKAAAGHWSLLAQKVSAHGCRIVRTAAEPGGPAMLEIGSADGRPCLLDWRDCTLTARIKAPSQPKPAWAEAAAVGDAEVARAMDALLRVDPLTQPVAYRRALDDAAVTVLAMPPAAREAWKAAIAPPPTRGRSRARRLPAAAASGADLVFAEALAGPAVSRETMARALEDLVSAQAAAPVGDDALRLADTLVGGAIENCRVDGALRFGNGLPGQQTPRVDRQGKVAFEGPSVLPGGADLRLAGNRFSSLQANVSDQALDPVRLVLTAPVPGHARLCFDGNTVLETGNLLTAASFVGQGNVWTLGDEATRVLGLVIADRASFCANLVEGPVDPDGVSLGCSAERRFIANAQGGNVLVFLDAWR
jgi:hypothetical protein